MKTDYEKLGVEIMNEVLRRGTSQSSTVAEYLKSFENEIRKELNEFIGDIAKLLPSSDGLGYDGLSWSIDDFKNAIQEVREDQKKLTKSEDFKIVNEMPVSIAIVGGCGIDRIDTLKAIMGSDHIEETRNALAPIEEKPYITYNLSPGFSESQIEKIKEAISFWNKVIIKGAPNGLAIDFHTSYIDRKGGTYAMASHTLIDNETGLPSMGMVKFDINDLRNLEKEGRLLDVAKHEICHVLGFGGLWEVKELLHLGASFKGAMARKEFRTIFPKSTKIFVPVENTGSIGTKHSHWRESVFDDELMTGYLDKGKNPLSRMTIASLEDLGYDVNYEVTGENTEPVEFFETSEKICEKKGCKNKAEYLDKTLKESICLECKEKLRIEGIGEGSFQKLTKTQPCPICNTPLVTPKDYFPALAKFHKELSDYEELFLSNYKINKLIDEQGHTHHCAQRIVFGDGECECKKTE